jgi:hypothetical protein
VSSEFCFFHPRGAETAPIPSTLGNREIRIIAQAIRDAWEELGIFNYSKSDPFEDRHLYDEDEISTKLVEILNNMLTENRGGLFRKNTFHVVVRDGKQTTGTRSSRDQMPDITFRTNSSADGEDLDESALFVEAKCVDHQSGCGEYVRNGLHRFVSGKYAPRVTFGMMLGYTVDTYTDVPTQLSAYYKLAKSSDAKACIAPLTVFDTNVSCYQSEHKRGTGATPDFSALHLWVVR